jgi:phosphoribosylanthranilate isomerase
MKALSLEHADQMAAWPDETLILLDSIDPVSRGGTGIRIDWQRAATIARTRRVVLAGGLTAENVGEAVRTVQPFGVDVASGVEASPGVKDHDKVRRFVAEARDAFERLATSNQQLGVRG